MYMPDYLHTIFSGQIARVRCGTLAMAAKPGGNRAALVRRGAQLHDDFLHQSERELFHLRSTVNIELPGKLCAQLQRGVLAHTMCAVGVPNTYDPDSTDLTTAPTTKEEFFNSAWRRRILQVCHATLVVSFQVAPTQRRINEIDDALYTSADVERVRENIRVLFKCTHRAFADGLRRDFCKNPKCK